MIIQCLGWVGNIFLIVGLSLIIKKQVIGFYAQILANALYFIQALLMNNISLLFLTIVLIYINYKGIKNWKE